MNKIQFGSYVFALLFSSVASAHHSFSAHFDMSRSIEIRGTVVEFKLRSPHASLVMDGQSYVDGVLQDTEVQRWEVESQAAPGMRAMGIDAQTFKPGDSITIIANPNRQAGFRFVNSGTFIDATGKRYSRANSTPLQIATADSVGNPASLASMAGRWSAPGAFARQDGSPLPLNDAGRAAWTAYDPKLSPANTCEAMNFPDMFNAPYLFDVRVEGNQMIFHNQPWEVERRIPLTNVDTPTFPDGLFGVVRGSLEGNTVILQSDSFPASRWGLGSATQFLGSGADIPSSSAKRLTERFALSADGLKLLYDYTLEDLTYLSAAFQGHLEFIRVAADTPMYPYECDVESAAMFSRSPEDSALKLGE